MYFSVFFECVSLVSVECVCPVEEVEIGDEDVEGDGEDDFLFLCDVGEVVYEGCCLVESFFCVDVEECLVCVVP